MKALIERGHKVTILAPSDASTANLKQIGCDFLPLNMKVKGLNPFQEVRLCIDFVRIFRDEKPDVILSFTIKNNIFGGFAAKYLGLPFLPNVTGLGTSFLSGHVLKILTTALYKKAFKNLQVIFFQNNDDSELFINLRISTSQNSKILPGSGVDLESFGFEKMPYNKNKIFLMVSRLLKDKGVVEFVTAARFIKKKYPDVRFQLLGSLSKDNRSAISKQTLQRWVEAGDVDYLGFAPDVRHAISEASCIVLPSYREGTPRTLLEASAMGRPIITTDVPGCRGVVDPDSTGYLCKAKDVKSLVFAMERILSLTDKQIASMGLAGREKMEKTFDQDIVVGIYLRYIDELTR